MATSRAIEQPEKKPERNEDREKYLVNMDLRNKTTSYHSNFIPLQKNWRCQNSTITTTIIIVVVVDEEEIKNNILPWRLVQCFI